MRKLSLYALASFLILWGINLYIMKNDKMIVPKLTKSNKVPQRNVASTDVNTHEDAENGNSMLNAGNIRNLDKIGDVINEKTVQIEPEEKEKIKKEKVKFDNEQNLQEKVTLLEQSFLDRHSTVKDIKRLQSEVQDLKIKMKLEVQNTEKWDPMFIYYLMISENYTYLEINQIKSLSENGISKDELNYINDLIKQNSFKQQVMSFKSQGDVGRAVANLGKRSKPKEKDEYIDSGDNAPALEEKLIEMNYGQEQRDEMVYGHSVQ
jgi:hypothetical protein